MTLKVHHLRPAPGANTAKTRVGRGEGSKGKTAGRGTKGSKARYRSRPASRAARCRSTCGCRSSRASRTRFKVEYQVVNLAGSPSCSPTAARSAWTTSSRGAVRKGQPVKVLGTGDLAGVKPRVTAHAFSDYRQEKITAAGGTVTELCNRYGWWPGADRPATGCYSRSLRFRTWRTVSVVPASGLPARRRMLCLPRSRPRFRTPDLRKKLLFTLAMIAVYRLGSNVPTPDVSTANINSCINQVSNGASRDLYSLVNLFCGGALLQLAVFALGIMPYITASIIIQLLVVVIPRFEQLKKEGQSGQTKLTQYTRYLTIGLAILQSTGIVALARTGQLFQGCNLPVLYSDDIFALVTMVITMTAGTAVIMWLGELVTDRGVGNGMSVLIFTSIAARIPGEGGNILRTRGGFIFTLVCLLGLAIIAAVVFVEQAQRRIPVQYAKRMVGRRMYGGTSTYLPLKVNQAGVIPVIFASSLLYLPQLLVAAQQRHHQRLAAVHPELRRQPVQLAAHPALLRPDHLLHVLLRVDHVQPGGAAPTT